MQLVTEDNITELAAARWSTARDPRLAELMGALVRHLHAFAREVRLTEDEWMAAMQWLTRAGQISDDKREEFILASDVLGLSMLVVQMNHRLDPAATPATVLGPFHIAGSPELEFGADMSQGLPGTSLYISGTVRDLDGKAIGGAVLDVWQADTDGAYEAQLPDIVRPTRPVCARNTRPDPTAPTACGQSPRSATASPWTDPSATSSRGRTSAISAPRTFTSSSTCPPTSR